MKRDSVGNLVAEKEDYEKCNELAREFLKQMKKEGLAFMQCEYVLNQCKSYMMESLLGELLE
jgi:hypothetical protein